MSLTSTPPVSSAAFQVRPQSLRLTVTWPSKPMRSLPNGSLAEPPKMNGTTTGRVVSLMVRSPVTATVSSSTISALVALKVMVG